MVKASFTDKEVVSVVTKEVITLSMGREEAQALTAVLRCVAGSPVKTRRGLLDKVYDALRSVGITADDPNDLAGCVTFSKRD